MTTRAGSLGNDKVTPRIDRSTRLVDSRATSSGGGRSALGSSPLSMASIAAAASDPIS